MEPQASEEVEKRHPTLRAFERQLPDGWRSFPECMARTTLLRGLARAGAFRDVEILPPDLIDYAGMFESTEWLPEVIHTAVLLAVRDGHFPGEHGEDEFLAWMVQLNDELMPDLAAHSPATAMHRVAELWNGLHRGTPAWVLEEAPGFSVLFMTHPPGIFAPLVQRWRRDVLASFLASAGAEEPHVRDVGAESGTRIEARWG